MTNRNSSCKAAVHQHTETLSGTVERRSSQSLKQPRNLRILLWITSIAFSVPMKAQVKSELPSFDTEYRAYDNPYECYSAVTRIHYQPLSRDALSYRESAILSQIPQEVKEAAEKCIHRINVDRLSRLELIPMMRLFLTVDRDKDAADIVQRLINGQGKKIHDTSSKSPLSKEETLKERADIHYVVAITYLNAIPARLTAALSHMDSVAQVWTDNRVVLVLRYYDFFNKARSLDDKKSLQKTIHQISNIEKRMFPQERRQMAKVLFDVQQHATVPARLDSLRKSTSAYVALQTAQNAVYEVKEVLLGTKMESLQGEFRFPASATLPVQGKVNLVVVPGALPANSIFPMLRRLKNKYNAIEIVYADRTTGRFDTQLVEPSQEAEMRRQWVQEFIKLPSSVVIEKSDAWRLPEPDRRLIYGVTPNIKNYGNRIWLVDQNGKIVHYAAIDKKNELEFDRLIEALLKQR